MVLFGGSVACALVARAVAYRYVTSKRRAKSKSLSSKGSTSSFSSVANGALTSCDSCSTNDMLGSVKPYDRHVIICTEDVPGWGKYEQWPSHIEDEAHTDKFPLNISKLINGILESRKQIDSQPHGQLSPSSVSPVADNAVAAASTNADSRSKSSNNCSSVDGSDNGDGAHRRVPETEPVKPIKKAPKASKLKVRVTLCHQPSRGSAAGEVDVVVYPEGLVFSLLPHQAVAFAALACSSGPMLSQQQLATISTPPLPSSAAGAGACAGSAAAGEAYVSVRRPPWDALVLVCVHGNRDKRCGRAGPQVISELRRQLAAEGVPDIIPESSISSSSSSSIGRLEEGGAVAAAVAAAAADIKTNRHTVGGGADGGVGSGGVESAGRMRVAVRGSSHIGGHKYAGTLIVYPAAQWYGRVTSRTAAELLWHVRSGSVLEKCSRGRNTFKSTMPCQQQPQW